MSKEIKVGLIAIVSGALLYYGFNYLKGVDFFSSTNKYYAVYENVDGLVKSNPVIVNGLAVGRVNKIRLLQEQDNLILVEMDIDESITLGDSTVASLTNTDLLGSKGIVLKIGPLTSELEPGDTVKSYLDPGLSKLFETVDPVANNLNTTITRVNEILLGMKGSGEIIAETLAEVKKTTLGINEMIAQNKYEVAKITARTASMIEKLNRKLDNIDPILAKTEGVLDSLNGLKINETLMSIKATVDNLNETVTAFKNPDGSLGKLINNDSLYNNLNQTVMDLDKLIIHMDQYPKHFFSPLGKKHEKVMKDLEKNAGEN